MAFSPSTKSGFGGVGGGGGVRPEQLEALLPRDGSRPMLAGLVLAGDPTQALHAATKQYVDRLIGLDLHIIGAFNAPANTARYLPGSGYTGTALLPANQVRPGEYVIVEVGGTVPPAGPVAGQVFNQGDLIISDGIVWTRLAIGGQIVQASGVVVNPPVHGETNTQAALERTLDQRGGTISGTLVFISDDPLQGAAIYKKAAGGLMLRCSAGNIQPGIEGNDAQNPRPILDPQNLWLAGFLNGQTPLPFVDLNTVQPPGYRCGVYGLADGVDYPNLPPGVPVIGTEGNRWLLLFSHLASASSDIIQILYDVCRPAPRIWSRYKVDGAVNWSAWGTASGGVTLDTNQTITGIKTFAGAALVPLVVQKVIASGAANQASLQLVHSEPDGAVTDTAGVGASLLLINRNNAANGGVKIAGIRLLTVGNHASGVGGTNELIAFTAENHVQRVDIEARNIWLSGGWGIGLKSDDANGGFIGFYFRDGNTSQRAPVIRKSSIYRNQPQIEEGDGSNPRDIIDTVNGDARYVLRQTVEQLSARITALETKLAELTR
jgi:hypothetical protein